jgi:hypothetical protein
VGKMMINSDKLMGILWDFMDFNGVSMDFNGFYHGGHLISKPTHG